MNLPNFVHETIDNTIPHDMRCPQIESPRNCNIIDFPETIDPCRIQFDNLVIKSVRYAYPSINISAATALQHNISGPEIILAAYGSELNSNAALNTALLPSIQENMMQSSHQILNAKLALDLDGENPIIFQKGKSYALVGQNRSGKSTLVKIICKLVNMSDKNAHGDITLNGQPFHEVPRIAWRNCISYVAQRPYIFPGTVMENIRCGNLNATDDEVSEAAAMAGLFSCSVKEEKVSDMQILPVANIANTNMLYASKDADIDDAIEDDTAESYTNLRNQNLVSKPWERSRPEYILRNLIQDGLDVLKRWWSDLSVPLNTTESTARIIQRNSMTAEVDYRKSMLSLQVSVNGTNLSGGFQQSLSLARIFLRKDAQFVILDEAMGQMDAIKTSQILPKLFAFIKNHNMTLLIISHHLRSIAPLVDEIYVLHDGHVVQHGKHSELLKESGIYTNLIET
jgi:ABC-type multidrug transport system fused ATPase/permease subunit